MNKAAGEPAFPTAQYAHGISPTGFSQGMTLRQYAAIHAMQGIMTNSNCMPERQEHFNNIALDAIQAADTLLAMLEATK